MKRRCFTGTEFQFGEDDRDLEIDGGDGSSVAIVWSHWPVHLKVVKTGEHLGGSVC